MPSLRLVPIPVGAPSGIPFEVTKDSAVVGRDPACDLVVSDGSVSRRHVRLERRGDTWFAVDQGSANGTFVDAQRISESPLRAGQELRIGAVAFRVELPGAVDSDSSATVAGDPGATILQAAPPPPPAPSTPPASRAPAPPPPPPPPK